MEARKASQQHDSLSYSSGPHKYLSNCRKLLIRAVDVQFLGGKELDPDAQTMEEYNN